MTGVATHVIDKNRICILVDLSPAASFISALYNSPANPNEFERYAESVLQRIDTETRRYYETCDPKTNKIGIIESVIWSTVMICPSCSAQVPFWQLAKLTALGRTKLTG